MIYREPLKDGEEDNRKVFNTVLYTKNLNCVVVSIYAKDEEEAKGFAEKIQEKLLSVASA